MPSFVTIETPSTSTVTVEDTVTAVEVHGRGIGDAPVDGEYYARRNEAWYQVDDIAEAPKDSVKYGRINGDWEAIDESVKEAPEDGNQYARQSAGWQPITIPDGGIPEAPSNGIKYGRRNEVWSAITEGFADAPANGNQYARKNNGWEVVQGGSGGGVTSLNSLTGSLSLTEGNNVEIVSNGVSTLAINVSFEIYSSLPNPAGYNDGDVVLIID